SRPCSGRLYATTVLCSGVGLRLLGPLLAVEFLDELVEGGHVEALLVPSGHLLQADANLTVTRSPSMHDVLGDAQLVGDFLSRRRQLPGLDEFLGAHVVVSLLASGLRLLRIGRL